MSGFFDWACDIPKTSFNEESILDLKDKLMSLRAKRRMLNYQLEKIYFQLRDLERECSQVMDDEEKIEDQLDRRKR